jgi:hypothetical protein
VEGGVNYEAPPMRKSLREGAGGLKTMTDSTAFDPNRNRCHSPSRLSEDLGAGVAHAFPSRAPRTATALTMVGRAGSQVTEGLFAPESTAQPLQTRAKLPRLANFAT